MDDGATDTVDVTWTRDQAEARDVVRLYQARSRRLLVRLRAAAAVAVAAAVLVPVAATIRVMLGAVGVTLLLFLLLMPPLVRASARLNPRVWAVGIAMSARFTAAGMRHTGPFGTMDYDWADLDLERTPTLLVARRATRPVVTVPIRLFDEMQVERVLAWSRAVPPVARPAAPLAADAELRIDLVVVTGPVTLGRAHRLITRPPRWRWILLLVVVSVVLLVLAGRSSGALAEAARTGLVWGLAAGVLVVLVSWFAAWQVTRRLGATPITWEFSPTAVTTTSSLGRTSTQWASVQQFTLRGDMLVLHVQGMRARMGALVGPLAPEQRERVLGWVSSGSSNVDVGCR